MKTQVMNRNLIVSIFAVMLLVYGSQGVSYGQTDAPTVTPGETNTSLVVQFQITLDEGIDENAYQIQLRQKSPQGEWITKCVVIERGKGKIAGDPDVSASPKWIRGGFLQFSYYSDMTFHIRAIFANLDPGNTYEVRYRDTNVSVCSENPSSPDQWSQVGEGATHLVAPPRAEFVDANLAKGVRNAMELDTEGGHIDLLKIPQASLAKLTQLNLEDAEITDLTGLEQATQLTELYLSKNQISDITPLAQLTELIDLDLSYNQIRDMTPLAQLTQLTLLDLWNNLIEDTFPLKQLLRENPKLDISTDMPIVSTEPGGSTNLYFINDKSIQRVSFDGTHRQNIVIGLNRPRSIALDVVEDKIYWINGWPGKIHQANFDGSNVETIVDKNELAYPSGIALDVAGGKIYWADEDSHKIQRANLDGTDIQDIVTGLDEPIGIALDVAGGKIYWTDEGTHKIQRANLDGTNIQDIVVTGLVYPSGIALDVADGKIYWAYSPRYYADIGTGKIQRANLNGTNIQDIVTGLETERIALGIAEGKIYWTEKKQVHEGQWTADDRYAHKIQRANLDGTNVQSIVVGLTDLRGIALTSVGGNEFFSAKSETSATTDATVSILPASVASPAVGEQLEISLNITGGETVAGYQVTVRFDDTALRYVESSNSDYLPGGGFFVPPILEKNLVKLNAASLAGESNGDGTLATLTFEVVAAKTSTLTLSDVLLTDSAGETFVPKIENAEITEAPQLKGDVNGDGIVNIQDLVLVAGKLGQAGTNGTDVNGDGQINIQDLVLVAGALGTTAAAPSLNAQLLSTLTTADVKLWLSQAQQLNLTDTRSQRGILFLQQLLTVLTPKETVLLANYPNPFNPETWIPYHLAKDADVTLHIYAVNGTLVRTLSLGHQAAGMYQNRSRAAYWDGKNAFGEKVASGVYFYRLIAGDFTATRKMLIRK